MHEWPLGMFPLTWPVCTKTNLFVEYSVNGKTMKHRGRGSTFFVTHFSAEAYLPFGSDVFQLPTCNHVVKKTLKLSLAFFSRELMTWGPLVDNEQWERCFWFDSDFLLEFCGKITLFEKSKNEDFEQCENFENRARGNRKTLKSLISALNSFFQNFKLKSCSEYLISGKYFV